MNQFKSLQTVKSEFLDLDGTTVKVKEFRYMVDEAIKRDSNQKLNLLLGIDNDLQALMKEDINTIRSVLSDTIGSAGIEEKYLEKFINDIRKVLSEADFYKDNKNLYQRRQEKLERLLPKIILLLRENEHAYNLEATIKKIKSRLEFIILQDKENMEDFKNEKKELIKFINKEKINLNIFRRSAFKTIILTQEKLEELLRCLDKEI